MLALFDRGRAKSPEYLTIQYETKLKNYRKNYEKYWLLMKQYDVTEEFRVVNYYYKKWGHLSFTIDMNECEANLSLVKFKKKIIVWCGWRRIYGLVEDSHVVAENSKFSVLFEKLLREVITI
ncbi:hypothetical protein BNJ_00398 [Kaumoebavirus]|uniref:hypothetical protein n=1 Tax=Kaumoebavirus TaxID=1859492 RepID=UPI0009C2CE43|nr:hypothetical protein BNJ_00398 [Kaumoebavirus]ARA72217.1 hypothetical protein BNJ_00398 [Kaumoebavirus]